MCVGISLGYLILLIYISVFLSVPYHLDYCKFVVQSEVRQVDSSIFIFLFQLCYGYFGIFCVSINTVKFFIPVL